MISPGATETISHMSPVHTEYCRVSPVVFFSTVSGFFFPAGLSAFLRNSSDAARCACRYGTFGCSLRYLAKCSFHADHAIPAVLFCKGPENFYRESLREEYQRRRSKAIEAMITQPMMVIGGNLVNMKQTEAFAEVGAIIVITKPHARIAEELVCTTGM